MKPLKAALVAILVAACFASVLTSNTLAIAGSGAEQPVTTAQLDG